MHTSKTNNETADGKLRQVEGSGLKSSSDDEDDTGNPDGHLAAKSVRDQTGENSAYQRTTAGQGGDEFLFAGGEFVTEGCANADENRGDVASVVT